MTAEAASIGPFRGEVARAFADPALVAWLGGLDGELARHSRGRAGQGGSRLVELTAPAAAGPVPVVVKLHGRQAVWKDWADARRGTAAERAWRVACRMAAAGVGTPPPVAWLERWRGPRLDVACFVTRRVEAAGNLRDELNHLLRHEAFAERLMPLLLHVARAVRALHDAGIMHGDLGNQNILLRRVGEDCWDDVQFVDLNRARLFEGPAPSRARAFDVSRLYLPSDLMRIFLEMYFGRRAPPEFLQMEERYRRRFAWHTRTRALRHPWREARVRRESDPRRGYPKPAELWIWDEKSGQPINAWRKRERDQLYPWSNHLRMAGATLRRAPAALRAFRELEGAVFTKPVSLAGAWAVAVEPRPASWDRELALLRALGPVPVLIRLYRHKGARQWDFAVEAGMALRQAGHGVAYALVQDRRAIVEPAAWAALCERVVPQIAGQADFVEIGHAVNRVKWGLWRLSDYRRLIEPLRDLRETYPALRLTGPAVIDFEYPHLLGFLEQLPRGFRFDALSHHLYVDRRGAPENRQGRFDALGKFALARAIARTSDRCADRLIVSEVNWPLADTGVYSPVCTPYLYPGQVVGAPNVTEDEYADFMVRYLLQAVCSGLVERVYWWRLAARGYGLVDDIEQPWRPRPAYHAFRHAAQTIGSATFLRNLPSPPRSFVHLLARPDGEQVAVAYAWGGPAAFSPAFAFTRVETRAGVNFDAPPAALTGHPVYYRGVRA